MFYIYIYIIFADAAALTHLVEEAQEKGRRISPEVVKIKNIEISVAFCTFLISIRITLVIRDRRRLLMMMPSQIGNCVPLLAGIKLTVELIMDVSIFILYFLIYS